MFILNNLAAGPTVNEESGGTFIPPETSHNESTASDHATDDDIAKRALRSRSSDGDLLAGESYEISHGGNAVNSYLWKKGRDMVPTVEGFVRSIMKKLYLWNSETSDALKSTDRHYDCTRGTLESKRPRWRTVKKSLAEIWYGSDWRQYIHKNRCPVRQETSVSLEDVYSALICVLSRYIDGISSADCYFYRDEHHIAYYYPYISKALLDAISSTIIKGYPCNFLGMHVDSQLYMIESNPTRATLDPNHRVTPKKGISLDDMDVDGSVMRRIKRSSKGRDIKILTLESLIFALIYNSKKIKTEDEKSSRGFRRISENYKSELPKYNSNLRASCSLSRGFARLLISPEVGYIDEDDNSKSNPFRQGHRSNERFYPAEPRSLSTDSRLVLQGDEEKIALVGLRRGRSRMLGVKRRLLTLRFLRKKCYERYGVYYAKVMRRIKGLYGKVKKRFHKLKGSTLRKISAFIIARKMVPRKRASSTYVHGHVDSWGEQVNRYTNIMRTCSQRSIEVLKSEAGYQIVSNDFFESLATPKGFNSNVIDNLFSTVTDLQVDTDEDDEDVIIIENCDEEGALVMPSIHENPGHRIEILSVSNVKKDPASSKIHDRVSMDMLFNTSRHKNKHYGRGYVGLLLGKTKKNIIPFKFRNGAYSCSGLKRHSLEGNHSFTSDSARSECYGWAYDISSYKDSGKCRVHPVNEHNSSKSFYDGLIEGLKMEKTLEGIKKQDSVYPTNKLSSRGMNTPRNRVPVATSVKNNDIANTIANQRPYAEHTPASYPDISSQLAAAKREQHLHAKKSQTDIKTTQQPQCTGPIMPTKEFKDADAVQDRASRRYRHSDSDSLLLHPESNFIEKDSDNPKRKTSRIRKRGSVISQLMDGLDSATRGNAVTFATRVISSRPPNCNALADLFTSPEGLSKV